ncbi:chitobiosyldiphosphodolichol beta-mannosyltransferase [Cystoisospora suis]|uniref:Chitobiosyldiphosphodolichol beta-mannosyltransferase n=1 Tax=Cystoisospora suis TaxID=483139 RepID=A0A2C6L0X1_9APIC|nr:chitobiosyldiphosphodolichol beta-mannosyltransferase [Cystoisospora suis]
MAALLRDWSRRFITVSTWGNWDIRALAVWLWSSMAAGVALSFFFLLLVVFKSMLSVWGQRKSQKDTIARWEKVYGKGGRSSLPSSSSPSGSSVGIISSPLAPSSGSAAPLSPHPPSVPQSSRDSSNSSSAFSSLTSHREAFISPQHVIIVVLGDLARSPRMIYHAQALSACVSPPPIIHLVAYVQTPIPPSLSGYPYLIVHPLPPFYIESARRFFPGPLVFIFFLLKLLHQSAALASTLFTLLSCHNRGPGTSTPFPLVLVQSPPALPTVPVCGVACRCTGAKLLLDWHNLTYTLLFPVSRNTAGGQQCRGTRCYRRWAVALASFIEGRSGRFASAALCVSQGMRLALQKMWGLSSIVLYDRPNPQIRPITLLERHALAMKYMRLPLEPGESVEKERRADSGEKNSKAFRKHTGGWRVQQTDNLTTRVDEGEELLSDLDSEEEDTQGVAQVSLRQQFCAFVDDCDAAGEGKIPVPSGKSLLVSEAFFSKKGGTSECSSGRTDVPPDFPRTHLQSHCRAPLTAGSYSAPGVEPVRRRERTLITQALLVDSSSLPRERTVCADGTHAPRISSQPGDRTGSSFVEVAVRRERPAVLLAATSWTGDEDLDLLLRALRDYDRQREWQFRNAAKPFHGGFSCLDVSAGPELLPPLLVLISGRGPGKTSWLERARQGKMRHVAIRTLFAPLDDYYKLLAAVDVGISMHTSSSGVDLPMKVVDLKGAGVPVCAFEFPTIHELVRDAVDSLLFVSAEGLCAKLQQLLRGFPQAFDRAVRHQASAPGGGTQTDACSFPQDARRYLPGMSGPGQAGSAARDDALQSREARDIPLTAGLMDTGPRAPGGGVLFQMRRFAESEVKTSFTDEWREVALPILKKLLE